jgi:hypothetical protein
VLKPTQDRFITHWANLLESVGWDRTDSLQATASVTFPLGAPITDGITVIPKTVVGCNAPPGILTIGGQEYSLYDPFKQEPGTTTDCHFVQEGLTSADTLGNLVDAINTDAVWFAALAYNGGVSWTLTITATSGGPIFNEYFVNGNIISGSTTTYGGGYKMTSSGATTSAQFSCTLTSANRGGAGDDYLNGLLKFDFLINGGAVTYQLLDYLQGTLGFMGALGVGAVPQYTIIANPFGFAVFDKPHDLGNGTLYRFISLFCMAPFFPTAVEVPYTETFVPAYAVFVLGPNTVGGTPAWNLQAASTMSLHDDPFQRFDKNPYARALCYQTLSLPLLTFYGVPMYYGPYVQFGSQPTNSDPAWVVGKLWDCAIVTDYVAVGAELDDRDFLAIGGSDGSGPQTVGTFMMDAGTSGNYPKIGQSARCASAAGSGNSGALGNTAR